MGLKETAYLSLGSNLGDRSVRLREALDLLAAAPGVRVKTVSEVFETAPLEFPEQGDFLNLACALETSLNPRELLELCRAIETRLGRTRGKERYGPREIDLDIIAFGEKVIAEGGLEIPHPRYHARRFVLEPLRQIAPEFRDPRSGEGIAEMLRKTMLQEARSAGPLVP